MCPAGSYNGVRYTNGTSAYEAARTNGDSNRLSRGSSRKDLTPLMNAANKLDSDEKKQQQQQQQPWYGKSPDEGVECDEGNHTDEDEDRRVVLQLKREGTVKDLTQKLTAQNLIPSSPVEEKVSRYAAKAPFMRVWDRSAEFAPAANGAFVKLQLVVRCGPPVANLDLAGGYSITVPALGLKEA